MSSDTAFGIMLALIGLTGMAAGVFIGLVLAVAL